MPLEWSVIELPGVAACLRIIGRGLISREDTDALLALTGPGGPRHGLPLLILTHEMTSISPEARAMFASNAAGDPPWTAMVVVNPLIRVASNFMIRVTRNKKARLFPDEAAAIRWLEDRLREETGEAGKPGPQGGD